MNSSQTVRLRKNIAAISLISAPVLFLVADIILLISQMSYLWIFIMGLGFVVLVPAILGLVHLLREREDLMWG